MRAVAAARGAAGKPALQGHWNWNGLPGKTFQKVQKWRSVPEVHTAEGITKIAQNRGGVAALLNYRAGSQFRGRNDSKKQGPRMVQRDRDRRHGVEHRREVVMRRTRRAGNVTDENQFRSQRTENRKDTIHARRRKIHQFRHQRNQDAKDEVKHANDERVTKLSMRENLSKEKRQEQDYNQERSSAHIRERLGRHKAFRRGQYQQRKAQQEQARVVPEEHRARRAKLAQSRRAEPRTNHPVPRGPTGNTLHRQPPRVPRPPKQSWGANTERERPAQPPPPTAGMATGQSTRTFTVKDAIGVTGAAGTRPSNPPGGVEAEATSLAVGSPTRHLESPKRAAAFEWQAMQYGKTHRLKHHELLKQRKANRSKIVQRRRSWAVDDTSKNAAVVRERHDAKVEMVTDRRNFEAEREEIKAQRHRQQSEFQKVRRKEAERDQTEFEKVEDTKRLAVQTSKAKRYQDTKRFQRAAHEAWKTGMAASQARNVQIVTNRKKQGKVHQALSNNLFSRAQVINGSKGINGFVSASSRRSSLDIRSEVSAVRNLPDY